MKKFNENKVSCGPQAGKHCPRVWGQLSLKTSGHSDGFTEANAARVDRHYVMSVSFVVLPPVAICQSSYHDPKGRGAIALRARGGILTDQGVKFR
jgi:hypothetical protein